MKLLVTGSSGLIGSEVVDQFATQGHIVYGIDNNQREVFFGKKGSTRWNQHRLEAKYSNFFHNELDIRDREGLRNLVGSIKPDAIVHTAAQPSHDKAASIPFDDFDTNAVGTLNLLEAIRSQFIGIPFVHLSTNKVYGDKPNSIKRKEKETRYEFDHPDFFRGINESFSIDQSIHSLFGASKVSADIMVQEYGKYFGMNTCCLRGGCLTGPSHSGVELHGFLNYLVKTNLSENHYTVFGYKGKQIRDNIHSIDVVNFIKEFIYNPRKGEVYNLGGGYQNTISIIEAIKKIELFSGKKMNYSYQDKNRIGDHIVYYSDLSKCIDHYPNWKITRDIDSIIEELVFSIKNN